MLLLTLALLLSMVCCRVSEKGTLQLSIDADGVRRLLLELPKIARPLDDEADSAPYAHYVEREMGGAVNLVKVLQVGVRRCHRWQSLMQYVQLPAALFATPFPSPMAMSTRLCAAHWIV